MDSTTPFKRLILRTVLRQVNPMVIRLISVPDCLSFPEFHEVIRTVLGGDGDLGYIVRVHGQEFNSFRRKTRSKTLRELKLYRQEKFLYICDTLHMWEWDVRVIDIEDGAQDDDQPLCLAGRGAAPPEHCGGPTGYRLMLKRQRKGASMFPPAQVESVIEMLAAAEPEQSAMTTWDLLREVVHEGERSLDRRLQECGPLEPNHFSLSETNERLSIVRSRRFGL
jgi:hypothetical protein